jgi:serine/threonine protein kinase
MATFPKIPGYRITRLLGQGGMSNVYLAKDSRLDRNVAIKVLFDSLSEDSRTTERFLHEAKTAARLQHNHIVHIYDVGRNDRHYFMVMELLHGSLKEKISNSDPLSLFPQPGLSILRKIALALDHAHQKGVIHRDIKPDNIMFRNNTSPVLVDFGISRCLYSNSRLTRTGMSIGTPHYMSPEQINGDEIDGRSDLYSLGVVLYEMLTGEVPYSADEAIAVAMKHVREPIPELPESMLEYRFLIQNLMAKTARERPQSGCEVARMIESLTLSASQSFAVDAENQPHENFSQDQIPTLPDVTRTGLRRWRSHNRGILTCLAFAGLLLNGSSKNHQTALEPAARQIAAAQDDDGVSGKIAPVEASLNPVDAEKRLRLLRALMAETRFADARRMIQSQASGESAAMVPALKSSYTQILKRMQAMQRIRLRSEAGQIDEVQARNRIRELNGFDKTWNPDGDFSNRFQARNIHNHKVVIDLATGLMWLDETSPEPCLFKDSLSWITRLNRSNRTGFNDWRLPTIEEAASLLDPDKSPSGLFLDRVFSLESRRAWTADSFPPRGYWYLNLRDGGIGWNTLGWTRCHILPVRSVFNSAESDRKGEPR